MTNFKFPKLARKLTASAAVMAMLAGTGISPFISGPLTVLAKAEEKTVKLNANGGEFPQGIRAVATVDEDGTILSLPNGNPTRKGWVFQGWVSEKVEEKVHYTVAHDEETGQEKAYFWEITPDPKKASFVKVGDQISGVKELYALYTPTTISYTMYPCGWMGNYGALKVSREYGLPFDGKVIGWNWKWTPTDSAHETLTQLVWNGHELDGWYTSPDGGTKLEDETTPVTSDTLGGGKVYLHWHKTDSSASGAKDQSDWMKNYNIYNYVSTIDSIYRDSVWVHTEDGKDTVSVNPCEAKAVKVHLNINGIGQSSTWSHVKWSVDDESIASISSNGTKEAVLTPKKAGTVTVKAELTDDISKELEYYCGSKDAKIDDREKTFEVTFDSHENLFKSYTIKKNDGSSEKYDYCQVCGKKYNIEQIPAQSTTGGGYGGGGSSSGPVVQPDPVVPDPDEEKDKEPLPEEKEPAPAEPETKPEPQPEPQPEPEIQPGVQGPEIFVDIPQEPALSDVQTDEIKSTDEKGNEQTITTYDDGHTATKIESQQATSSYRESQEVGFAGAEITVKDPAAQEVSVEMKSIPVSETATYPITLSVPEGSRTNVSIPVENGNWGTVALLVDEGGKVYQIDSSYFDGNGNLIVPVTGNMKVVLQNRAKNFADVPGDINEYPANNIAFLSARGIMSGKSDGTNFDPTGELTRGQFALMMYRKAGSPTGYNSSPAPAGVPEDEYYVNAAKWAVGTGLMGQGGSAFNGNKAITREQLALILYRQSGQNHVETASLENYTDSGLISSSDAQNAISWAVSHKIMGNNTQSLKPQANTMRQDVAAMVARWIQPAIAGLK